jgi:hypothetical protein
MSLDAARYIAIDAIPVFVTSIGMDEYEKINARRIAAAKARSWRAANPEKVKLQAERRKQRCETDPEYAQFIRESTLKSNAKNRENRRLSWKTWAAEKRKDEPHYFYNKRRANNYKNLYGLTLEQYEAMLAAQDGRCAICGQMQTHARHKHLYVDHDHKTNKNRGLLCYNCNVGIGHFRDDLNMLLAAVAYIAAHKEPN